MSSASTSSLRASDRAPDASLRPPGASVRTAGAAFIMLIDLFQDGVHPSDARRASIGLEQDAAHALLIRRHVVDQSGAKVPLWRAVDDRAAELREFDPALAVLLGSSRDLDRVRDHGLWGAAKCELTPEARRVLGGRSRGRGNPRLAIHPTSGETTLGGIELDRCTIQLFPQGVAALVWVVRFGAAATEPDADARDASASEPPPSALTSEAATAELPRLHVDDVLERLYYGRYIERERGCGWSFEPTECPQLPTDAASLDDAVAQNDALAAHLRSIGPAMWRAMYGDISPGHAKTPLGLGDLALWLLGGEIRERPWQPTLLSTEVVYSSTQPPHVHVDGTASRIALPAVRAQIRSSRYAALHSVVVLEDERPKDADEIVWRLARGYRPHYLPPETGSDTHGNLMQRLELRGDRMVAICREGAACLAWRDPRARDAFTAGTWTHKWLSIYLSLCLHARVERFSVGRLAAEIASFAPDLDSAEHREPEAVHDALRRIVQYTALMTVEDAGGLTDYARVFRACRSALCTASVLAELRAQVRELFDVVVAEYALRRTRIEARVQRAINVLGSAGVAVGSGGALVNVAPFRDWDAWGFWIPFGLVGAIAGTWLYLSHRQPDRASLRIGEPRVPGAPGGHLR